jgi:predicted PurR-regulated permease PerM
MVLATAAILLLGWEVRRVLTWIVVAVLLAVVLGPVVDLAERRLRLRRALATLLVFLLFLVALAGIVTVLVRPLATELPEDRQERVRRVAADCSKAVTGYMTGNLVISVIAGTLTYIVLWIMGVPYKGVVALFVGFADLIPLVGATLGAIVAIAVAALHSLPAALVVLVFFVVYQQAENHLLQPVIMSRTVQLSALTVTVAILLGVELLGFLGALLAIPVAGILHVIGRDLYDGYRGRLKSEPTIGEDEVPVSAPDAPDRAGESSLTSGARDRTLDRSR